jgi:transcriptional regulator with PAS, ATPase and Fis domain
VTHRASVRLQPLTPAILPVAGESRDMRELVRQVDLLASAEGAPALLVGEPGVGKGWLAEYIHTRSARARFPFGAVNCATMNRSQLYDELFGAADGSEDATGMIEAARGGSICIEEISQLPPQLQHRLSDLIRSAACTPDEDASSRPARVIAAESRDLVTEVNEGRFREDLYYQLSVTPIHVPPLRARSPEDLLALIVAVIDDIASGLSGAPRELGEGVTERLLQYSWPGNLRELRNVMERAMLACRGETVIQRACLPPELAAGADDEQHVPRTIADVERAHIHRTLHAHKLNRTHAARELGISRATLIKKIREYGLAVNAAGAA